MNQQGFSLMETCVSMVIIGLMLSISVPNVQDIGRGSSLQQTAYALEQGVKEQAAIAVQSERPRAVVFDAANRTVSAGFADVKDLLQVDTLLNVPRSLQIREIKFSTLNKQPNVLVVRPNATATAGRVVISDGQRECRLIQPLRGLPRIECPDVW